MGSFSSLWTLPAGAGYSLQNVAQCQSGAYRLVIRLWFVVYMHQCSFESSGRTWIPGMMVYILFEYVISPMWISVCLPRDTSVFIGTDDRRLGSAAALQNLPEAHSDGYSFRQVHPLGGIILIDKLICDTQLTKWQKHSLSHAPVHLSNYLTVWNCHSHVKNHITFPLLTLIRRILIYLFFW